MAEKAYLLIRFNIRTIPPAVLGATVASYPLTSHTITGCGDERWVELLHVRGNTFGQAEDKLFRMVQGLDPCPYGDLRFLWPLLNPSKEAHEARYELGKRIEEGIATLSPTISGR